MDLDRYLARTGYDGSVSVDVTTLAGVVEAHAHAVPYENLDVFLQNPVTTSVDEALAKIVDRGRGGWCYEMNGAVGWALDRIGFEVTRMTGAANEAEHGSDQRGNHLVLRVDLEEPWIVDIGLGGSLVRPFRLVEGPFEQDWRQFGLEHIGGDQWRLHNRPGALPPSFDWIDAEADEALLADYCRRLQDDERSLFRENLIVIQSSPEACSMLLGRVVVDTRHGTQESVDSEAHLLDLLVERFGLALPDDTSTLWERVEARHAELFGT